MLAPSPVRGLAAPAGPALVSLTATGRPGVLFGGAFRCPHGIRRDHPTKRGHMLSIWSFLSRRAWAWRMRGRAAAGNRQRPDLIEAAILLDIMGPRP